MLSVLLLGAGFLDAGELRAQGVAEARFAVTGFKVEGDNPLAPDATQRILAPFAGDSVTIDRVQAAAGALETELKDRGYAFLRVVLPPQDARGVITLRVLAFRLNAISITGNQHFDNENILRSLPSLRRGESPNLREIARSQALANDHLAKQVQVTMQQGSAPDTVDAAVKVEESNPQQFFVTLNNTGTSRTGQARYEGRFDGADFGIRHSIELAYNISGGGSNNDASYVANRAGASASWQALRYSLEGSKALGSWAITARLRGQFSNDALIPGEQFGLGGAGWVRGLEEREGTGDKGYVVNLEVLSPPIIEGLRALVFTDAGQARNSNATAGVPAKQGASSAGLGLRYQWRRNLSAAVDWAYVLNGTGTTNSNDNRFHASLIYRF